jgi:hypothetical protein
VQYRNPPHAISAELKQDHFPEMARDLRFALPFRLRREITRGDDILFSSKIEFRRQEHHTIQDSFLIEIERRDHRQPQDSAKAEIERYTLPIVQNSSGTMVTSGREVAVSSAESALSSEGLTESSKLPALILC